MEGNDPGLTRRVVDLEWAIMEGDATLEEVAEYEEYVRQHAEWIRAQPWFNTWEMSFGRFLPDDEQG